MFLVVFVAGCRFGVQVVVVTLDFLCRCGLPVWGWWVWLVVRIFRNVLMFAVCVWRCGGRWVCIAGDGWVVFFLFFVCILCIVDLCLLFFRSRCKGSWAWVVSVVCGVGLCLFCFVCVCSCVSVGAVVAMCAFVSPASETPVVTTFVVLSVVRASMNVLTRVVVSCE